MRFKRLNVVINATEPDEIEELKQRGFTEVKAAKAETVAEKISVADEPEEVKTKKGKKAE